MENAMHVFEQI